MKFYQRCCACWHVFWTVMSTLLQVWYGVWFLSRLQHPIITIFGGSKLPETDRYFRQALLLAERFARNNVSVLTGGGQGIMEAASCGAVKFPGKGRVIGIGVSELKEKPNPCVQEYISVRYFFARKWLLTRYSQAIVIFPGGYGTLDELAEVITLIQVQEMPRIPIVLFGTEYWNPLMSWLRHEALKHGTIQEHELSLFTITDDLDEAFSLVCARCKNNV